MVFLAKKNDFSFQVKQHCSFFSPAVQFLFHYVWEKGTQIETQEKPDRIQPNREYGTAFLLLDLY